MESLVHSSFAIQFVIYPYMSLFSKDSYDYEKDTNYLPLYFSLCFFLVFQSMLIKRILITQALTCLPLKRKNSWFLESLIV